LGTGAGLALWDAARDACEEEGFNEVTAWVFVRNERGLSFYGWGPRQLNPPPPAPGMRREWVWSPSQMAECGGPCWEAQDPRSCDCGALWRDVPLCMDEGQTQRGNGNGGPTTPKPPIKPEPHGGRLFINNKLQEDI
jgi:hypothetical protein